MCMLWALYTVMLSLHIYSVTGPNTFQYSHTYKRLDSTDSRVNNLEQSLRDVANTREPIGRVQIC